MPQIQFSVEKRHTHRFEIRSAIKHWGEVVPDSGKALFDIQRSRLLGLADQTGIDEQGNRICCFLLIFGQTEGTSKLNYYRLKAIGLKGE